MPKVSEHTLDNFSKIMQAIEKFQNSHSFSWYRGMGSVKHELLPSLFRHPVKKDAEALHKLERDLAATFSQRSPPFVSQIFDDE